MHGGLRMNGEKPIPTYDSLVGLLVNVHRSGQANGSKPLYHEKLQQES